MSSQPSLLERTRDHHSGTPWPQALVILLGAAIAATIVLLSSSPARAQSGSPLGFAMGELFCVYVSAGIVAGIVYACTRKRSLWPTSLTAAILMVVVSLPVALGAALPRRSNTAALWRKLDGISNQMIEEMRAAAESDRPMDVEGVVERKTAEMEALGAEFSGNDAVALKVGTSLARDMATISGNYLNSIQPFLKAGGMKADTLRDQAAVTRRRRLLSAAIAYHAATLASMEKIPEDVKHRATRLGLDPSRADAMCQGMLKGMNHARLLQFHRLERDMIALSDEHLADLEKRAGDWHVSNGQFIFDTIGKKSLDAFNARVQKLQSLADQQKAVQAEWIASRQRP